MKLLKKAVIGILAMSLVVPTVWAAEATTSNTQTNIEETYGKAVNLSTVKGDFKVTVENILVDAYCCKMLVSVEKVDGTSFNNSDEPVVIDELAIVSAKNNGEEICGSGSYSRVTIPGTDGKKVYFQYSFTSETPLPQNVILKISSLDEEQDQTLDLSFNIKAYLNKNNKVIVEDNKEAMGGGEPKHLLKDLNLNLEMLATKPGYYIENIGMVDGKLHVLTRTTKGGKLNLNLINKKGEAINGLMYANIKKDEKTGENKYENYYILDDVKSTKDLEGCKFVLSGQEILRKASDIAIPVDLTHLLAASETKNIEVNKTVSYGNEDTAKLVSAKLTNMTVKLDFENVTSNLDLVEDLVALKMKDGTKVAVYRGSCSYSEDMSKQQLTLHIAKQIKPSEVASLIVGNTEIPLN